MNAARGAGANGLLQSSLLTHVGVAGSLQSLALLAAPYAACQRGGRLLACVRAPGACHLPVNFQVGIGVVFYAPELKIVWSAKQAVGAGAVLKIVSQLLPRPGADLTSRPNCHCHMLPGRAW